jgi:hypothetical protein
MKWGGRKEKRAVFIFTKDLDGKAFIRAILDGSPTAEVGLKLRGGSNR